MIYQTRIWFFFALCVGLVAPVASGCGDDDDVVEIDASTDMGDEADDMGGTEGDMGDGEDDMGPPECTDEEALCGGDCVVLESDPDHCGACENACGGEQLCFGGECLDDCPAGLTDCGGDCVDLNSDEASCGACDFSCRDD